MDMELVYWFMGAIAGAGLGMAAVGVVVYLLNRQAEKTFPIDREG